MPLFGKKPATNIPAITAGEMKARLLGLNRLSAPFSIVDGQTEGVDLVAEIPANHPHTTRLAFAVADVKAFTDRAPVRLAARF